MPPPIPSPAEAAGTLQPIDAASHVAGATVRHLNPFSDLDVPRCDEPMSPKLLGTWVTPVYLGAMNMRADAEMLAKLRELWTSIDDTIVLRLLAEFDWRPRLVAALLIALKRLNGFDDALGRLLLRSDVCYAGRGYCLALAASNSDAARDYLRRYLDYYLTRPELDFDQGDAIGAIAYLDPVNRTNVLSEYRKRWDAFAHNKSSRSLQREIDNFHERIAGLDALRAQVVGGVA